MFPSTSSGIRRGIASLSLAPRSGGDSRLNPDAPQHDEADIFEQRARIGGVEARLRVSRGRGRRPLALADTLVRKSVWIVGGDGWGYDIGYGGLDHVLASGRNVKVLAARHRSLFQHRRPMLESHAARRGREFAAGGKRGAEKDLGLIAMTYGNIYVASVAMGAKDEHTLKAFLEAEAFDGPALIIAYSHCIAHGIDMVRDAESESGRESGQWLLYRYNPGARRAARIRSTRFRPRRDQGGGLL